MRLWTRSAAKTSIKVHTGQDEFYSFVNIYCVHLALERRRGPRVIFKYQYINYKVIRVLSKDGYLRKTVHEIHTSNASVATAQKENRVSISPVKTKNCNYDTKLYCFNTIFKPYYTLNRTVAQYDIFLSWLFVQTEVYFRRYKGSLRRHKSESVLLTPFVPCKWAIFLLQPFDVFHHFVHVNCIHTVIQAQDLAKRLFQNTVIYKKK